MLKINIKGVRGEGKTTLAVIVGQFLKSQGYRVSYQGSTDLQTKNIQQQIDDGTKQDLTETLPVSIVDVCDEEYTS